ncbi:hypothetical protein ABT039_22050 [Streptomyces lasiicapitis]|uniref:hypothetical protein n=1 Tax=Streptomyces lasiicapitis TaxID=1923961 RepID=UPI00332D05D9
MARLAATVYVKDPETFQWVTCDAGTEPAPRLAQFILTPAAWQDGVAPTAEPVPDAAPTPGPADPVDAEPEKKPRTRRPTTKADD